MTKTTIIAKDKEHLKELIKEAIQAFGLECDLNYIDVSQVTDMSTLFLESKFNGDISAWNTSNVQDMRHMFYSSQFNRNVAAWNVENVVDMTLMFKNSKFNDDLSKWNVANVKSMFGMFHESPFNGDISTWDVANVMDMELMFYGSHFKDDLSTWLFHNDVDIEEFFDAGEMDQFKKPNLYHWLLLLNGSVTQNGQWREHVDAHATMARSLTNTENEAAIFMHKTWLNRQISCEAVLSVPFESLEMP